MCFFRKRILLCIYRGRRIIVLLFLVGIFSVLLSTHVMLLSAVSLSSTKVEDMFVLRVKPSRQSSCVEKRNFVFIKQMKCATSTLLGTWYRFGYKRNLSFVSPRESKLYLNWPYLMTKLDYRPSRVGYNILTEHSIYTPDVMESIMPNDTVYLSILRYPLAQVQSVFQYFKLDSIVGIRADDGDVFTQYFSDINRYEKIFTKPGVKGRFCIPDGFSMTKNLMSHSLGMPLGFPRGTNDISGNIDDIDRYMEYIDQKFALIMIVEYFYESLILVRRLMCWKFNDLLFMRANVARYSFDTKNVPQHVKDLHKNWSSIDYRLYEHFNRTFWKKVSKQSNDFFDEVSALKYVEKRVEKYCSSIYPFGEKPYYRHPWDKQFFRIEASKWTSEFKIYPEDCWMLGPDPYKLYRLVQVENDHSEWQLLQKLAKVKDTRRPESKALC